MEYAFKINEPGPVTRLEIPGPCGICSVFDDIEPPIPAQAGDTLYFNPEAKHWRIERPAA